MAGNPFNIRHGQFHDVDGPARRFGDFTFVPALIALNGTWFQSAFELQDYLTDATAVVQAIVRPGEDAPWVLGRLMRLFGTQQVSEEERMEKSCFFASFLAVLHERDNLAVPFECSDYYGESALTFSTDDPPDQETQAAIAQAFWRLLLANPTDVADYEDKMYHLGASVWIQFGIENGEPFMIELLEG